MKKRRAGGMQAAATSLAQEMWAIVNGLGSAQAALATTLHDQLRASPARDAASAASVRRVGEHLAALARDGAAADGARAAQQQHP